LTIDGEPFGGPVVVRDESVPVERTVPRLEPGSYTLRLVHEDLVLATAEIEIVEPELVTAAATAPSSPAPRWLIIPLGLVVAVLGWRTMRQVVSDLPPRKRLGPISAWRVRRGRHPLG